ADFLFNKVKGAIVLINSESGEILVMVSHPVYDPNKLGEIGQTLSQDKDAPLINRAAQGMYPPGTAVIPFYHTLGDTDVPPGDQVKSLYESLGFYSTPQVQMPVTQASPKDKIENLRISPLQMALAAATLSNNGMRPAPRIALAVNTPQQGWVVLPSLDQPVEVFSAESITPVAQKLAVEDQPYWEWIGKAESDKEPLTWYLAGTLPNWQGLPLTIVILIEGDRPLTAQSIGRQLIQAAIKP
ncbi:MAG: hypothetical protein HY258_06210, partial [Chloroflexi bacterium]|nr:hypothetical protein [Chloroflexota bacterium]